MVAAVTPFLMFQGSNRAETAMALYVSLFPDAEILSIERYGPGEQGAEGSVKVAAFRLGGQTVKCIDSPVSHAFDFTRPSPFSSIATARKNSLVFPPLLLRTARY